MALALRLALAAPLLAAALPAEAKAPPLPGPGELLNFVGTEPFWSGTVRHNRLVFKSPDNERGETIRVRRADAAGRVLFRGRMAREGMFTMTVRAGRCSDGMSESDYPYDVTIAFGSNRIRGCGWTARHRYKPGE